MKKPLSKAKNNTNVQGDIRLISPLFDVEQMKRDIASQMRIVTDQMPRITEMLKWQAPFIKEAVKQANDAAKRYHDLVTNTGIIDQIARMHEERVRLHETLKNTVVFPERTEYYIPAPTSPRTVSVTKKENVSLEISDELVDKVVERLFKKIQENEKNIVSSNSELVVKNLPKDASWYNVTISLGEGGHIEIRYNKKFVARVSFDEIGFIMKNTKEEKTNLAYKFLETLSAFQLKEDIAREATVEKLMSALKLTDKQTLHNTRTELTKKLRKIIDEDPFESYRDFGYYKLKFRLIPSALLRGDGEIYLNSSGFDENFDDDAEQDSWHLE